MTILIGLPDTALREARDRIRAAIVNSGESWPQQKITVGLSPASLPKRGSGFDLAIAIAILAADEPCRCRPRRGRCSSRSSASTGGCDRSLECCRQSSPAEHGVDTVVVAAENAAEAGLVPGVRVVAAGSLAEVAIWLRGGPPRRRRSPRRRRPRVPAAPPRPGSWTWRRCLASPRPGWPRRSAPPAATTCPCSGRPGRARRCSPSGCRPSCPGWSRRRRLRSRRSTRWPGRCRRGRGWSTEPPFCAPHHTATQGRDRRRRQRAHPAGRGQPRASRRAVPRRGAGVRPGRARRAAPAARGGGGGDRPAGDDRPVPGPVHPGPGGQPVPVRQGATPGGPAASAARRPGDGTWGGCPGRCWTGWT